MWPFIKIKESTKELLSTTKKVDMELKFTAMGISTLEIFSKIKNTVKEAFSGSVWLKSPVLKMQKSLLNITKEVGGEDSLMGMANTTSQMVSNILFR